MSVLYRGVWSSRDVEDADSAIALARHHIAQWAHDAVESAELTEGIVEFDISNGRRRRVQMRTISPTAFEAVTTDRTAGDPTEAVTVIRVIADHGDVHTLVEQSMASDDPLKRESVGRPRIVHTLLEAAVKPVLGGSAVLTEPVEIPAEGIPVLTEMLANPDRTLPLIVCAEPYSVNDGEWQRTAATIAAEAEGAAVVLTLERDAVFAFRRVFGPLAIWDGAVRIYAPEVVTPDSDGWRHRYHLRARFESDRRQAIDRIVYSVTQLSTRRRIPDVFRTFDEQPGRTVDAPTKMVPAEELEKAREEWQRALEAARDEQSSLEKELAGANGHLARLKEALNAHGLTDLLWGTQHEDTMSMPDEVQSTSDAALAAQMYLSDWLVVPDSAVRELDDIDTAPEAYNWGNKTWRGLRSLAAYAEDRATGWNRGGFWEWCAAGPLLSWPATSKKLSMSESDFVQRSEKLARTRVFKVDRQVAASGETTMLAHLKISEGGGQLAPRVYFFDDTNGSTKKIHVGLIGPHYLVPNKSTN